MRLKSLHLENFRCYENPIDIEFDDLTAFIGKNDAGKSTILEALEIFFNNDLVKIEASDASFRNGKDIIITCDFTDLPQKIILDSGEVTSLDSEYLTYDKDRLRIKKVYPCKASKMSPSVFLVARHPSNEGVNNLLSMKEKDLQELIKQKGFSSPLKGNPSMRKALWSECENLQIEITEIEVSKTKEEGKEIWSKLANYLPTFAYFQSDRSSQDSDDEVQNPMKGAIQEALSEVSEEIRVIQEKVKNKAMEIAEQTHNALRTIDEDLAHELSPSFTNPPPSKWANLFSVSLDTEQGIPLNKRGSGIRRLVLVGFFKAEVERKAKQSGKKNIIYAIEEPETAQHPKNQLILIHSFRELAQSQDCQVILTTHSPGLARELPVESLRFIDRDSAKHPLVRQGETIVPLIAKALGVYPESDKNVKVILCVEGPTDVIAFQAFSRCLREKYPTIVDLENDNRVLIIPLGGSTLAHYVEKAYLNKLGCPEVHIYDNDVKKYQQYVDAVNKKENGSWATLTQKYEIENYLHPEAIYQAFGVRIDTEQKDVPKLFADAMHEKESIGEAMKPSKAKKKLSGVFTDKMNIGYLEDIDKNGEVRGWLERITKMLDSND